MRKLFFIAFALIVVFSVSCKKVNQKKSDITPPSGASIVINSGAVVTTTNAVTLSLSAVDAYEMYITNIVGCSSGGTWEPYSGAKPWTLGQTNATATVYAKFRDRALNVSECVSDSITHDDSAPTGGTISINGGATHTNSTSVTLNLSATDANEMYVTDTAGCGGGGTWQGYSTSLGWTLGQTNGTATVYVKYRDANLNESSCFTDAIIHDDQVPSGESISINSATAYTNSSSVTLTLGATGASEMCITNTAGCSCANPSDWENYSTSKAWTLGQTNATATVYVKYRDAANNQTSCINDTIIHDNQNPTGESISINSAAAYTTSSAVTLTLGATGASEMCVTNTAGCSCSNPSDWENYNTSKAWTLGQTNATATVYVKFRDAANNQTSCINDTIIHDDQIPAGESISINSAAAYTNSSSVTLTLGATGASEMCITNTAGCSCSNPSDWESYSTSKAWTLGQTNATATVYVKYRDAANNQTSCINDTIIHDSQAPTGTSVTINNGDSSTTSTSVTLNLAATGASSMYVTNNADCGGTVSWEDYAISKAWTLGQSNGTATVYAKFKDAAGNESGCESDTITVLPDVPFGITGKVQAPAGFSGFKAIIADSSGNIYAGTTESGTKNIVLLKFDIYGNRDTAFGNSTGKSVLVPAPSGESGALFGVNGLAFQSDGKIVATGSYAYGGGNTDGRVFLARVSQTGVTDTSLWQSGFGLTKATDLSCNQTFSGCGGGVDIAIQSTGRIIVAMVIGSTTLGEQPLAFKSDDGNIDTSFGAFGTGYSQQQADGIMALQADDKVVSAVAWDGAFGNTRGIHVSRTQANGVIDTSFGSSGTTVIPLFNYRHRMGALKVSPSGKIIVSGRGENEGGSDTGFMFRLNPDGTLDETFGNAGILYGPGSLNQTIAIQPNNYILVSNAYHSLYRYSDTGVLDTSFGVNGEVNLGTTIEYISYLAGDKILLSAGGDIYRLRNNGLLDTP